MPADSSARCPECGAYLVELPPVPGDAPVTAVEARLAVLEQALGRIALLTHRLHAEQALRGLRLMVRTGVVSEEKAQPDLEKLQRHLRADLGGTT